jgi:hypothetical protein
LLNKKGKQEGNCGVDEYGGYKHCSKNDTFCGTLQCTSYDGSLAYKEEGESSLLMHTSFSGGICWSALLYTREVGYVPNGAKCGVDKVCSNQKCIEVEEMKTKCANCHGNGVCNSKGHCHCNDGWAPPYCNEPGDGGSVDSRKESNEKCETNWKINDLMQTQSDIFFPGMKLLIKITLIFTASVCSSCLFFAGIKILFHFSSSNNITTP